MPDVQVPPTLETRDYLNIAETSNRSRLAVKTEGSSSLSSSTAFVAESISVLTTLATIGEPEPVQSTKLSASLRLASSITQPDSPRAGGLGDSESRRGHKRQRLYPPKRGSKSAARS
jgi:hypothetical protein